MSDPPDPLVHARRVARLLDAALAIPGTSLRIGLDPLLGLIPGLGDAAGAILAGYIVVLGVRLGAGRVVIVRMLGNVAVDTLVGAVPVLGDLFDFGWRSNTRNVALLERHLADPSATRTSSALVVGAVVGALGLAMLGGLALTYGIATWILGAVS